MSTRGSRTNGRQARSKTVAVKTNAVDESEQRRSMIARAAYYRAERRGFEPGRELEDWVVAESEVDGLLRRVQGSANAIR